uniref:TRPM SLOG domain-containing protein n=1 Tax=Ditylenchus dipsaci TaxID=166011 RepID=A0A915D8K5_9BILA
MLALTSSTAKPMDSSHKSEGDLQIFDRDGQIPLSEEFNTNSVTGGTRRPSVGSLPGAAASQSPEPQLDPKLEAVCRLRYASGGSTAQDEWIEQTFSKRECCQFIASSRDSNKCGCGRLRSAHTVSALAAVNPLNTVHESARHHNIPSPSLQKWSIGRHTITAPTDAYGTLEFQGGPHPFKAQYLRLSFDSEPADIMALFEHVWQMAPPKLIITVHGGITNFDIQPKHECWGGQTCCCCSRRRYQHFESQSQDRQYWNCTLGTFEKEGRLRGQGQSCVLPSHSFPPKGKFAVLNNRHSYFLLVDNGTVGRYGADIILRRRLESYIAEKQKIGGGARSVPVVCVVLEGGTCTVRTVLDYVTKIPRVPVVVCDGSGRASDLLAFAHQYIQEDGNLPEANAQCLVLDILACVRQKHMITVFRLGENQKHDVDYAILTALLKGHNLSPAEQLSLALAWNRVDIARSDIL